MADRLPALSFLVLARVYRVSGDESSYLLVGPVDCSRGLPLAGMTYGQQVTLEIEGLDELFLQWR